MFDPCGGLTPVLVVHLTKILSVLNQENWAYIDNHCACPKHLKNNFPHLILNWYHFMDELNFLFYLSMYGHHPSWHSHLSYTHFLDMFLHRPSFWTIKHDYKFSFQLPKVAYDKKSTLKRLLHDNLRVLRLWNMNKLPRIVNYKLHVICFWNLFGFVYY